MLKKTLFNQVIYKGTLGAIYGIISGFILGLLIWALLQVALQINGTIYTEPMDNGYATINSYSGPPFEFFLILGMCFGAIIGSTFGSISALKEGGKK